MEGNQNDVDFYKGFEGEPELRLSYQNGKGHRHLFLWVGYFDQIMDTIEPASDGWSSLAYYYQLQEGWYNNDYWPIPDLAAAISQLQSAELPSDPSKVHQVRAELVSFLQAALVKNIPVTITYF